MSTEYNKTTQDKLDAKIKNEEKQCLHRIKKKFYDIVEKSVVYYIFFIYLLLISIISIIVWEFFKLNHQSRWECIVNIVTFFFGWLTRFIKFSRSNK